MVLNFNTLDQILFQFGGKGLAHNFLDLLRAVTRYRKANRMLRTGLGNQNDGDTRDSERPEKTVRRAGYADHSRAFEVDERDIVDRSNALYSQSGIPVSADS